MNSLFSNLFSKKKTINIEFCQNNLDRFLDSESIHKFQKLLSHNKISIKEFECLSHCKICEQKPFIKIDGEIVSRNKMNELVLLVQEKTV